MYRLPSAVLAFLVALGPALALDPPARYDYTPRMPVKIVRVAHLGAACQDRLQRYGCSFVKGGVCWVLVAITLPPGWYSGVVRHEKAHCNGWPGHHPR
jgi:hypothetical protein